MLYYKTWQVVREMTSPPLKSLECYSFRDNVLAGLGRSSLFIPLCDNISSHNKLSAVFPGGSVAVVLGWSRCWQWKPLISQSQPSQSTKYWKPWPWQQDCIIHCMSYIGLQSMNLTAIALMMVSIGRGPINLGDNSLIAPGAWWAQCRATPSVHLGSWLLGDNTS